MNKNLGSKLPSVVMEVTATISVQAFLNTQRDWKSLTNSDLKQMQQTFIELSIMTQNKNVGIVRCHSYPENG